MDAFRPDRDEVIRRAFDAGIEAMITIGSDRAGNRGAIEISERYDRVYAAVGFHPHDARDFTQAIFDEIRIWADRGRIRESAQGGGHRRVVAIGEIGLDYHYDHSPRDVQRAVFAKQLRLARDLDLPVVVHSRDAKTDTLGIVADSGIGRGVFHCFSGDVEMAKRAIALGFHISLAGPVTFKNAKKLREIAREIPDHRLLIETDAPYLTPEPLRGRRNEPAYLIHVAEAVAALRGVRCEDVARITTLNAKMLFGIGTLPEGGEIAYRIRDSLYLNVTNRCTNACSFCVRFQSDYVKGHNLRLREEPSEEDLKRAIGDPSRYGEVVFCGFGEPLLRLDLVRRLAAWVKEGKGRVRIDTNGHGNLIHGRNILPELRGIVDSISISLNAQDPETYRSICRPTVENAYEGVLDFVRQAKIFIPRVQVTVVALPGVDIDKCGAIARELGVDFRVRELDVVG